MIIIKSSRNILIGIVLLTSIILTTLIYSAFSTKLQIGGDLIVRSDNEIRVTNISIKESTGGAYETYNNKYTKDTTSMFVTLPSNSSVTYEVEITNKDSYGYIVDEIETLSNTNSNIDIDIELKENDLIDNNSIKTYIYSFTNNNDTEQTSTLVLKYAFLKNSFIVTFDANGGNVDVLSKEVSYGYAYGELPIPTREGYTFKGWNGKNKLNTYDRDAITMNGVTVYVENNVFNIYGVNTGTYNYGLISYNNMSILDSNGQYTLSVFPSINTGAYVSLNYYNVSGKLDSYIYEVNKKSRFKTQSIPEDYDKLALFFVGIYSSSINIDEEFKVQLEKGSTATEWEPYYVTQDVKVTQMQNHTLTAIWEEN